MMKLNILNMNEFLKTVNECTGEIKMISPNGQKQNIRNQYEIHDSLRKAFENNKGCLKLTLEVLNPKDYMSIVSYYAGDC